MDQIRYILSIFADRGVTVKQMQLEYDISYSVLNKIKISALNLQDKWKIRNIKKNLWRSEENLDKINEGIRFKYKKVHLLN